MLYHLNISESWIMKIRLSHGNGPLTLKTIGRQQISCELGSSHYCSLTVNTSVTLSSSRFAAKIKPHCNMVKASSLWEAAKPDK